MTVTLSEMKKLSKGFEVHPKNGKLGTILKKYAKRRGVSDPVQDIKENRMAD